MMKRRAFTFWELLIVVAVFVIGAAMLNPFQWNRSHGNARRSSCQSKLKQIGLAFAQYAKDYDDKFPPLARNWAAEKTQLTPYVSEYEVFQCPSTSGHADNSTDYFVNVRLAGRDKTKIANPDAPVDFIILSGDGADDQTSSAQVLQLPKDWRTDENSPAWRHLDGANYLFIDGHVKWYRAKQIFGARDAATPTFEVKP